MMRLVLLTAVVMVAFAANSLLNRAGLLQPGMGAASFGTLRLAAGALVLGALWRLRARQQPGPRPALGMGMRGVVPLLLYIYGFLPPMARWMRGWGPWCCLAACS